MMSNCAAEIPLYRLKNPKKRRIINKGPNLNQNDAIVAFGKTENRIQK